MLIVTSHRDSITSYACDTARLDEGTHYTSVVELCVKLNKSPIFNPSACLSYCSHRTE